MICCAEFITDTGFEDDFLRDSCIRCFVCVNPPVPLVTHSRKGDAVAIFNVIFGSEANGLPEALQFESLVRDPLFVDLNDVVAVSPTAFYVTSISGVPHGSQLMRLVETFGRRAWSFVVYCKRQGGVYSCKKAADNLQSPNGINLSPDKQTVYVANSIGMSLLVFDREENDNLTLRETVYIGSGMDNIEVDPTTGDLFIGSHQSLLHFLRHAADFVTPAPSQVLRIQPRPAAKRGLLGGRTWVTSELFMSDGADLPASSVATFLPSSPSSTTGRLLIGSVFSEGILVCELDLEKDERPYLPAH